MENVILPFANLPRLTDSIKQAIGLSLWSLFQVTTTCKGAKYLLQTPENAFLLSEEGDVLKETNTDDQVEIVARVFFEGYVIPSNFKLNSISNSICK